MKGKTVRMKLKPNPLFDGPRKRMSEPSLTVNPMSTLLHLYIEFDPGIIGREKLIKQRTYTNFSYLYTDP